MNFGMNWFGYWLVVFCVVWECVVSVLLIGKIMLMMYFVNVDEGEVDW